ncbi:MAG: segregation/condensation protein A, partial [Candidatus Competibacteraceae bacterium]|nr:segregation/condensation protein A [Candidatus Competibacteraceae bacterium]
DIFAAGAAPDLAPATRIPPRVELADLLAAFREVLVRAELSCHHRIQLEPLSVRERMGRILERMDRARFTPFAELFTPEEGRRGLVVSLLAVLELIREALVELVQNQPFAPIYLRLRVESADA